MRKSVHKGPMKDVTPLRILDLKVQTHRRHVKNYDF